MTEVRPFRGAKRTVLAEIRQRDARGKIASKRTRETMYFQSTGIFVRFKLVLKEPNKQKKKEKIQIGKEKQKQNRNQN